MKTVTMLFVCLLALSSQSQVLNPANGHTYQVVEVPEGIIWTDARDSALLLGGYLATITSQEEQDFINGLISGAVGYTLVGGNDIAIEGQWEWITGEPFVYTNWNEGEPNEHYPPEDYLMLFNTGFWNDGPNWPEPRFIVEWDAVPHSPRTLSVPSEYLTIQTGIDAASDGDTVLVSPGIYEELLDYRGKAIYVRSEFGPDSTILTYPTQCVSMVKLQSGEDTTSVLDGFTLRDVTHQEALIKIVSSSAKIINCRFSGNFVTVDQGKVGLYQGGYLILENNHFESGIEYSGVAVQMAHGQGRIRNNVFHGYYGKGTVGGAVAIVGVYGRSTILIEYNLFTNNYGPHGAGILVSENDNSIIRNNTFVNNSSPDGGGICIWYYCVNIMVENNLIVSNEGYGITNQYGSTATFDCNDLWSNTPSNYWGNITPGVNSISQDPLFCNESINQYSLQGDSPCLPDNNECGVLIGALGEGCACCQLRGDVDHDGTVWPTDLVYFVDWLWRGGAEPSCLREADVNGDSRVDPQDCIYLVNYFWDGGPAPIPCP